MPSVLIMPLEYCPLRMMTGHYEFLCFFQRSSGGHADRGGIAMMKGNIRARLL